MDAPPPHLGSSKSGSMKASQWQTVFMVTLLVTLTRVWGIEQRSSTTLAHLNHFLTLVIAFRLAHLSNINEQTIAGYEQAMKEYLAGLLNLFPEYKLKPKHHYSLHLGLFMRLFGPVKGWSGWAGERKHQSQKKTHTNGRVGELAIWSSLDCDIC